MITLRWAAAVSGPETTPCPIGPFAADRASLRGPWAELPVTDRVEPLDAIANGITGHDISFAYHLSR